MNPLIMQLLMSRMQGQKKPVQQGLAGLMQPTNPGMAGMMTPGAMGPGGFQPPQPSQQPGTMGGGFTGGRDNVRQMMMQRMGMK